MKEQAVETIFKVPKMDCPSEEHVIRMTLEQLYYAYISHIKEQKKTC